MNKSTYKIGGLILAGGEGQRVGRQNKGLLNLKDKPLVQHILDKLRGQLEFVAISANRDLEMYNKLDIPVFTDDFIWQGIGPLAGIASTYRYFPKHLEALLVVPCDTPFLPNNLVERLAGALFSSLNNEIAYAATKQSIHPSVFLCKPHINDHLVDHLQAGKQSLKSWIFRHSSVEVFFEEEHDFANINHLETLASYQ